MKDTNLHDDASEFFHRNGSVWMVMTPAAAIRVALDAAKHGLLVMRVECGIWHSPGFELRLGDLWDGADPPIGYAEAEINNVEAARYIDEQRGIHSAFVLTTQPLDKGA